MSPTVRALAQRLIAYEAALDSSALADGSDSCRVCEKLRRSLGTLVGPEAYRALAARALTRAKREAPLLSAVQVNRDGSIEGLIGEAIEANDILIAHLIGLLGTFLGETVTLWLLGDIWSDLPGSRIELRGSNSQEPAN